MIITLKNDFHNTEVRLRVPRLPCELSKHQINRAQRELCGMPDCPVYVVAILEKGERKKLLLSRIDWRMGRLAFG